MSGTILWYLHDQGRGHLGRARAVIPHLTSPVVVAAGPGVAGHAAAALDAPVVALPSDVPARPSATQGPWHHAPIGPEVRSRTTTLAAIVEHRDCTTAVVDVSMEVAAFARLCGLRTVALRQSGHRDDAAHRIGLVGADVVWVPQHPDLEPIDEPVDDRYAFTGAFSRFDTALRTVATGGSCGDHAQRASTSQDGTRLAVLLVGRGGTTFDYRPWTTASAPAGWRVVIAGLADRWTGDGICSLGAVEPVYPVLTAADVVVTSAGWASVADCVAAGTRLVVIPEPRPFDEQVVRADVLHAAGLALRRARWPIPAELGGVLDDAGRLDPAAWRSYHDGAGAQRAASLIEEVAAT